REVRTPSQHFHWRKPVGPFPLRADAESACPTVPIAAHADAVTNSLASADPEIEPPFCCVDENGSWRVAALKIDHGARNWPRTAVAEIKEGSERTDDVSWLGLLGKGKADPPEIITTARIKVENRVICFLAFVRPITGLAVVSVFPNITTTSSDVE